MASKDVILLLQGGGALPANLQLLSLPHPKGGHALVALNQGLLLELHIASPRRHSSWFIDQNVSSSSSFYVANVLDPRFLLLPYFERSGRSFSPLNQVVQVDAEESGDRIPLDLASTWRLEQLLDVNDKLGEDMLLYRFNEEKALGWLESKVRRGALAIATARASRERTVNSAFVSGFNASAQHATIAATSDPSSITIHDGEYTSALQIVSDYISDALAKQLKIRLEGVFAEAVAESCTGKRKADWELALEMERETQALHVAPVLAKPQAVVKKSKPPLAAPRGVKSITNFFSKK